MKPSRVAILALILGSGGLLPVATAQPTAPDVRLREDFASLLRWRPVTFDGRARTRYRAVHDGAGSVLEARADASASGLRWTGSYDLLRYPKLRWRWKVGGVYQGGDATRKRGDDCPLRAYVVFAYDPDTASVGDSLAHAAASLFTGEPPPHSALSYLRASRPLRRRILTSPYSGRARMVVLQAGGKRGRQWVEEEVDVLADYRAAFGEDPPRRATLGIMSDADDTGESATSWIDWIEIRSGGVE